MVKCTSIWIYYARFVESNDLRLMQETCLEYYGTFKKPREYMSQVTTTECDAKFTTLIYMYIYYLAIFGDLGFRCQHVNIWEHIYKALHQRCIKITFCRAKVSNAVLVGLYNTRRHASSSPAWFFGQTYSQNDHLSLSFLSKLSWYKNAHLELSTNGHPTLELFQKWHRFYRYIAIWLCIYLQRVHGLTTTADRIRASLSWQDYHTGGTCRKGWLQFGFFLSAWFSELI